MAASLGDPKSAIFTLMGRGTGRYVTNNYNCHENYVGDKGYRQVVLDARFWLESVVMTTTGTFGFLGNIITLIVFKDQRTRSNFHKMLMTLAVIDCVLILFYVIQHAIIPTVYPPQWWKYMFPYVFHPLKAVTFSASIFMVVAISAER